MIFQFDYIYLLCRQESVSTRLKNLSAKVPMQLKLFCVIYLTMIKKNQVLKSVITAMKYFIYLEK